MESDPDEKMKTSIVRFELALRPELYFFLNILAAYRNRSFYLGKQYDLRKSSPASCQTKTQSLQVPL